MTTLNSNTYGNLAQDHQIIHAHTVVTDLLPAQSTLVTRDRTMARRLGRVVEAAAERAAEQVEGLLQQVVHLEGPDHFVLIAVAAVAARGVLSPMQLPAEIRVRLRAHAEAPKTSPPFSMA